VKIITKKLRQQQEELQKINLGGLLTARKKLNYHRRILVIKQSNFNIRFIYHYCFKEDLDKQIIIDSILNSSVKSIRS
jgi:hypothetical protein